MPGRPVLPDSSSLKHDTVNTDGLFIRELRPARTPRGVFLLLHGMESHSEWFVSTAGRLVQDGWAVIAYDRPGWGKSPGRRGRMDSYTDFVDSIVRIAVNARDKYGPVHLAGMSWGGMAALYLGLRRGWLFDSITCLAPGLSARRDIPFTGKCRVAYDFLRRDKSGMVTPAFQPKHFTRDPDFQQYIADDPDRVKSVSTTFCLETLKMRRFIKETAGRRQLPPTLCLLAGGDEIIDNTGTADICRRAGAMVEILPDAAHTLIFERPEQTSTILSHHAATAAAAKTGHTGRAWIIGAGAVGGAMASLLAFGGVETGVLVKPAYLGELRKSGLTLQTGNARRTARDNLFFCDTIDTMPPDPDIVVVAVKSFDTTNALSGLAGKISERTVLASLQNGIGNESRIAALFPNHSIVAASICASLELTNPGHVIWADDRGGLGAALHSGNAEIAQTVWNSIMSRTGMECRWYDGPDAARRLKWSKLMLNTGFNALNSLTGMTSAALLADPVLGSLAVAALREGFAVMDAQELDPVDLPGFPVSKLRLLLKAPTFIAKHLMAWQAGRAPEAAFSMRQDKLKKRQATEIQELNGKIVEFGHHLDIYTTANAKLVEMVGKF